MTEGQDIRDARQRAGLTQAQLAQRIGVSQRTVGNWERGDTVPTNRWARIQEVLAGHWKDDDPDQVGLSSASDVELLAEIARRFARTPKEARHAQASEDQAGSHPDVRAVGPGTPMSLDEARRIKQDPAEFGDQPRRGDLDRQEEVDSRPLDDLLGYAADKGKRMDDE